MNSNEIKSLIFFLSIYVDTKDDERWNQDKDWEEGEDCDDKQDRGIKRVPVRKQVKKWCGRRDSNPCAAFPDSRNSQIAKDWYLKPASWTRLDYFRVVKGVCNARNLRFCPCFPFRPEGT